MTGATCLNGHPIGVTVRWDAGGGGGISCIQCGAPLATAEVETPVLDAVRADLADIDITKVPGGQTYRATALWLAQVIDKRGSEDGPSVTAKLADQLTKVMQLLTREGGDDERDTFRDFTEAVSTPHR